jgi:hypothetical protein
MNPSQGFGTDTALGPRISAFAVSVSDVCPPLESAPRAAIV